MLHHTARRRCFAKSALAFALFAALAMVLPLRALAAGPDPQLYQDTISNAVKYLESNQAEDGSYSSFAGPGVTALVTTSLLRTGRTTKDPLIAKSLKYLEGFVQKSGGIHMPNTKYRNYETCMSILCFTEANADGRYDKILDHAEKFVKGLQWDDEEGHDPSSPAYGGGGYGKHERPDLSNTNFLIDALKATGNGPEDPAMNRALIFISRSQNLESEHNTTPHGAKVNDGGFYYTPANGGESQAGTTANGGLRSYGSMTYAGLKSMIYAGVKPDDPRVTAAVGWVQKNYSLDNNPGMGDNGLYYYYHTFAKALDAVKLKTIVDEDGVEHDWRRELVAELAKKQSAEGSWTNGNARWLEGDPNLVTGYVLLALSYCRPDAE